MGMDDPTICVYQFICDQNDSNDTNIIQYLILHGQGLCIKLNSLMAHMFYAWSFINNTSVSIAINHSTYFISLNTYTTVFARGEGNSNKYITYI